MTPDLSDILKEMTKVFEGKIDFPCSEVEKLMTRYPDKLVFITEKKEDGYYSTIYVKEK